MQNKPLILALLAGIALSGAAQATLIGRDLNGSAGSFEAYYDNDRNITWLANANVNGPMTWVDANTWATNLSFTDGVNTYDNWRLPTSDTCSGYSCTGSEMGHLFYSELGGTANQPISTSVDPDLAKFTNLQASYLYWSGTEYAPGTSYAWVFPFFNGYQDVTSKHFGLYALAVSPGDVGAANNNTVPEPQTLALLGLGLGLLGLAVARQRG